MVRSYYITMCGAILIGLVALGVLSYVNRPKPPGFKLWDKVEITHGFYEGCTGQLCEVHACHGGYYKVDIEHVPGFKGTPMTYQIIHCSCFRKADAK